jgi:hypothetical protein
VQRPWGLGRGGRRRRDRRLDDALDRALSRQRRRLLPLPASAHADLRRIARLQVDSAIRLSFMPGGRPH